ncbi:MAG: arsenical pump rane protein, partial [Paenibacillaceae bacterium]|nr:arsenical pump rane protein [Paenibacillaceae bacterium]
MRMDEGITNQVWMQSLSVLLFIATIALVVWQPGRIGIGWPAFGGAVLALACGIVSFSDVAEVTSIVWNATLAFIGIIVISLVLEEIGFFEWAALHMARLAKGDGRKLFVYVTLLGAAVSAFFANDGAAMILTPIILAKVKLLKFEARTIVPFVIAGGFISDTTSLPLITSNLTNIMSTDFFGIGFIDYAVIMSLPNLVSLMVSLAVLYLYYRKDIPIRYDVTALAKPRDAITDGLLFRLSWAILAVLFAAYLASNSVGLPISAITGAAAFVLLAMLQLRHKQTALRILRGAPWSVVIFSIGMYVVVFGLRNAGLTDLLSSAIEAIAAHGLYSAVLGMGFIAALLCSAMNNLPTLMIDALAIHG